MPPEEKRMFELDDVGLEFGVEHHHIFQDLYLHLRLLVELGLVPDDLQSHELPLLVVEGLEHLPKRSLPETIHDLVSIGNGVAG